MGICWSATNEECVLNDENPIQHCVKNACEERFADQASQQVIIIHNEVFQFADNLPGLNTHTVGWCREYWNEDVIAGLGPHPPPVKPVPLEPIMDMARVLGVLGKTHLLPGTILYRGYGNTKVIHGLDLKSMTLTTDRITCFTPIKDYSIEVFGPHIISIVLTDPSSTVFCDDTECGECQEYAECEGCGECGECSGMTQCSVFPGKLYHCGDLGVEVTLLPGTYKVRSIEHFE